MRQLVMLALWLAITLVQGRDISRGDPEELEQRLRDFTESEEPLIVNRGECQDHYQKIGCYKDERFNKAVPTQLFTDRNKQSPIYSGHFLDWNNWDSYLKGLTCRCAAAAKAKGYTYFTTQYYGECYSGPNAARTYSKYGASQECTSLQYQACDENDNSDCVGKANTNFVYKLTEEGSGNGQVNYAYDA